MPGISPSPLPSESGRERGPAGSLFPAEGEGRYFWLFALAHLVVWTLVPTLAQPNAPLDVVEMAYWGREWQWGYPKHPPLAAWAVEAALSLAGGGVWAVYLLSQVAVVTCFWAAWRLGRQVLAPRAALLAAVALEGCVYYNFTTPEFNNNVALAPFWALAVLAFHRALHTDAARHWAATGACLGLGLLAKYSMGILGLVMLGFMLASPGARRRWARPGPYLAGAVGFLVFAPHLYWAATHRFPGVVVALERMEGDGPPWVRVGSALAFAGAQALALLPLAVVLLPLTGWRWRPRPLDPAGRETRDFLVAMGLGPLGLHLFLALLLDLRLRSMYGSVLWTFTGVLILHAIAASGEAARWRRAALGCGLVAGAMVVAAVAYDIGWPYLGRKPLRAHFPGRALAARAEGAWRARMDRPLRLVAGEWWLAGNVALYSPGRPRVYGGGLHPDMPEPSPRHNAWTSDEALRREGGLLLWNADRHGAELTARLCERFPALVLLEPLPLRWETGKRLRPVRVGLGLLPPEGEAPASADCAGSGIVP